jgi:hypothetical protein
MRRATMNQYLQIGAKINNGKIDFETAQALIKGEIIRPATEDAAVVIVGTVTVPDVSAVQLVAQAERRHWINIVKEEIRTWDFYQRHIVGPRPGSPIEVRGKRYEVLTWTPGDAEMSTKKVQDRFKKMGADGNNGAFIAWLMEKDRYGCFSTLPSDYGQLWFESPESDRHVLYYCPENFFSNRCNLGLCRADRMMRKFWTFVGFREVPA